VIPHLVVGPWGARFGRRRFPCAVGRGGIGVKRREGDGVSPRGRWRIVAVLARPDRLRLPRGARPIGPRDGWSDDPRDPAYNRPVRRPHPGSSEPLRRPDPLYDLVAVLDFNRDPVVRGAGSAIFLHVWRRPRFPTAGCIAFARADLAWILARWTGRSRVILA
jgi:L,D-peptidoglycan transpeptidase YkuD (ErfK/YbiS/YcfS/YnhG family)